MVEPLSPDTQDGTRYGHLAFDVFAVENWDYSASLADDRAQWERLVHKYYALTPVERLPYHEKSELFKYGNAQGPSYNQIAKVLEPHQTIRERLLSADHIYKPLWLRTCYKPEL
ncbi:hypothetical protein GQ53DRAFT_767220 [Thozetella sp. PMI_491]|nr:hypothetical protein GQ53DRAFT_767220 [Thozetella sp. PMI_491]